jgi:hypothetical protein
VKPEQKKPGPGTPMARSVIPSPSRSPKEAKECGNLEDGTTISVSD